MEPNTGTKPVSDQHAFDLAALQTHLEAQLAGFRGPVSVEQFKGGQSNPTSRLGSAWSHSTRPAMNSMM